MTSNSAGIADQQRRHRVDEALLAGDVGITRGDPPRAGEEEPVREPQHVRLVDDGHPLAPPRRERERRLDDALGAFARDLAHREGDVGGRHELAGPDMHGAVGIEAFGVLAHDHEIDVAAAARRQARPRPRRPDVGEQVEPAAQLAGRIEAAFGDRRIFVVRYRPEDDARRLLRLLDHGVGCRGAAGAERGEPDVGGLVGEAELELPVGGVEHLHGGRDDFRTDAVAGQYQKRRPRTCLGIHKTLLAAVAPLRDAADG